MTDPASTALAAPRLSLGDGAAAYEAAVERARTEDWATRLFARDVTLWTTRSAGRRGDRRAARLARCAGALRRPHRRSRGVRRRRRRGGLHDRGRRRHGRQQPRAGRPPPDVRLDRGLPRRCASSTRPTRRTWRRPSTTSTRSGRSSSSPRKSGTTTEPNAFLAYAWDRAEQALEGGPAPSLRACPAPTSPPSPTRAERRGTSSTTTTSARSSSTRPTSAAATRR